MQIAFFCAELYVAACGVSGHHMFSHTTSSTARLKENCWTQSMFCILHNFVWTFPHSEKNWDIIINVHGSLYEVKLKVIPQQAEVTLGVPGRLRPLIFLTFRHYKDGRSSAISTGRLYPRRNLWYSFSEAESTPGHRVPSVATEKIPCDTTGNRSRDRLTRSAVPYATPSPLYVKYPLLLSDFLDRFLKNRRKSHFIITNFCALIIIYYNYNYNK